MTVHAPFCCGGDGSWEASVIGLASSALGDEASLLSAVLPALAQGADDKLAGDEGAGDQGAGEKSADPALLADGADALGALLQGLTVNAGARPLPPAAHPAVIEEVHSLS